MSGNVNRRLAALVASSTRQTDAVLTHLARVLSSSAGIDAVLCTICYTLVLVHSRLARTLERRYSHVAAIVAKSCSPYGFADGTIVTTITRPSSRLSELTASVKALADMTADFRIFLRLWGLLDIYTLTRENYLKPPGDAILKTLTWAYIAAGAVFQVLENGAYLASKGVLRGARWAAREPVWWVWSNRFWMAQTLLEVLRLLRVRQLQYNEDFGAKNEGRDNSAMYADEKQLKLQSEELKRKWHRDFYANAAWLPLTLHWSFEDEAHSPISETLIGMFGMIPGIIAFRECWKQAEQHAVEAYTQVLRLAITIFDITRTSMESSHFHKLPRELRDHIYELALCVLEDILPPAPRRGVSRPLSPKRLSLDLTKTCRQIRFESLSVLYSKSNFEYFHSISTNDKPRKITFLRETIGPMQRWLDRIGMSNARNIKSLAFRFHLNLQHADKVYVGSWWRARYQMLLESDLPLEKLTVNLVLLFQTEYIESRIGWLSYTHVTIFTISFYDRSSDQGVASPGGGNVKLEWHGRGWDSVGSPEHEETKTAVMEQVSEMQETVCTAVLSTGSRQ